MTLPSLLISISTLIIALTAACAREQQQTLVRRATPNSNESHQHSIESEEIGPGLFSVSITPPADYNDPETRRRQLTQAKQKLEESRSCVLYLEDVYYHAEDPKNVEEMWVCTFENYENEFGGDPSPYSYYVSGDMAKILEFLKEARVTSGFFALQWDFAAAVTLNDEDSTITLNTDLSLDHNILWIEKHSPVVTVVTEEQDPSERRLATGAKKTLVIRIVGDHVGPSASLVQLREQLFGTGTGLKSQMESCSHGAMTIQPYSGPTEGVFKDKIIGGVVEVRISLNPNGISDQDMENAAMAAAYYVFGDLREQFDLVLFAMPPGIAPPFAAYAYINTPFSYYSDTSIEDTMVQMHEVGHNLGLQHSGQGQEEYGDSSGYMGYSETLDPKMCYNAVNNYQLGWYSLRTVRPISDNWDGGTYLVSGVSDFDRDDSTKIVSLRLEQLNLANNQKRDYYIGYNKAEGINAETQLDGDKVIVFLKEGGVDESQLSWKVAALQIGEMFVIDNFDNSGTPLKVHFTSIDSDAAVVDVMLDTTESPPSSRRPTGRPTVRPTASPTSSPTSSPTAGPTKAPTKSPTKSPTQSPTQSPTKSPTADPTQSPTKTPTKSPTAGPTKTPTESPLTRPTSGPTVSPSTQATSTTTPTSTYQPSSTASSALSTTTTIPCNLDLKLTISIRTDYFPEETSWKLRMIGGNTIHQVEESYYENIFTQYTESFCLDYETCYRFTIKDKEGDGMGYVGQTGLLPGYYEVYLGDELQVRNDSGDWGKKRSRKICTSSAPVLNSGNETDTYGFGDDLLGNETAFVDEVIN